MGQISAAPVSERSGTFTPTFTFATPGDLAVVYTAQTGRFILFEDFCVFFLNLAFTPTFTTAAGNAVIGGFPFAFNANSIRNMSVASINNKFVWTALYTMLVPIPTNGASDCQIRQMGSAQNAAFFTIANLTSGAAHTMLLVGMYNIA